MQAEIQTKIIFTIIVNAREKKWESRQISFEQVVALAFNPVPTGENVVFTVTYRDGPKENPKGSMLPGESVYVKDGMIFNVTQTDKS